MTGLGELFDKTITPVLMDIYWEALKSFDDDRGASGFHRAMTTLRFFPKPAELIELIAGNGSDIAEVEAGKVLNAIKRVGGYNSVKFDNQTTQAVIVYGFGGWSKMCSELTSDKEGWFLKDFARIYQAYAREGMSYQGVLSGRSEIENGARCLEDNREPVKVGELIHLNPGRMRIAS